MISGSCPYPDCDGPLLLASPDQTEEQGIPMWQQHECGTCYRVIWTYHSRLDPKSYTEPNFLAEYIVDEGNKTITRRPT